MKIEFGKALDNKTWRFLIPCFRGHGEEFVTKFNNEIFKLAYGIMDKTIEGIKMLEDKRPIFVLCDKGLLPNKFQNFISWLRLQPYFITDYASDTVYPARKHMIVIDTPKEYYNAYDKFSVGLYSEMYTKEQLEKLIVDKDSISYKVLARDESYGNIFIDRLEEEFNTNMTDKDRKEMLETAEYEYPYSMNIEDEIFNYN